MRQSSRFKGALDKGLIDEAHAIITTVPIMREIHLLVGLGADNIKRAVVLLENIRSDAVMRDDHVLLSRRNRLGQRGKR